MILSKSEAVQLYGTEKQKSHFDKYKRFVNKNLEESLFKTLQQNFENVDRIPKGRGFEYSVSQKRSQLAPRMTNAAKNGSWSIPYTNDLDKIILMSLKSDDREGSIGSLTKDFGLYISFDQHTITRTFKSDGFVKKNFPKSNPYVIDFVSQNLKTIENEVARSLSRLKRMGLITVRERYRAVDKISKINRDLDETLADFYIKKKNKILEEQEISLWYANNSPSNEKSVNYHNSHSELIKNNVSPLIEKNFNASYIYVHYSIFLEESHRYDAVSKYNELMKLPDDPREKIMILDDYSKCRKAYLLEKMYAKLQKIAEKEKPEIDEDGDEIPIFRNTTNDVLDYYYDMVVSGSVKKTVTSMMDQLFDKTPKEEVNNIDPTLNDSSTEFEMRDPSLLAQQQSHLSTSHLVQ